jgi:DHA2 family methylenomycin A resistance protein-like MFS transporter
MPQSLTPVRETSARVVLVVMCVGYFLVLLDVTIVSVALPQIGAGLGTSVSGLQWVVDGYAIALASLMLGAGTLGDIRGHKRIVLWGLAVFGGASLGAGLAPTAAVLVAFRVLQGIGAALLLPGTLAVITQVFPERGERAKAIGLWAGIGSAALPAGPLLGGALVQAVGWRAVFFVNVPIVVAALVICARVVPEGVEATQRRLDAAGILIGAALLAAITFAFIEGGRGNDVTVAVPAVVVLLAAFWWVERRAADPVLDLRLFRSPGFAAANAVAATMNLVSLGLVFVLTLYLQRVQGRSALSAGVAMIPLFAPLAVLAPLVGRVTARTGPRGPMAAGLLCAAGGIALLTALGVDSSYATLLPALLLWGAGLGILTPAVVAAAVGAVAAARAGLASAVNNTARQAGGAIGIAAFGALAGQPGSAHFMTGFHIGAAIGAALFLVAAGASLVLIRNP